MSAPFQQLQNFRLPDDFRGRPAWLIQLWWLIQATLFGLSPQFMYGWRRGLLRLFGARIGTAVLIRPSARITYPWKLTIGDHSWVGDDTVLYTLGDIVIGRNTVISQRSYICAATHDHAMPDFPIFANAVNIADEVWLATDVYVAPGTTIGAGSVVGARSSVIKSLPAAMICYGTPAVAIGPRRRRATPP
jgi:putative colanic acid biosynthesis acetyltransferase WcaF